MQEVDEGNVSEAWAVTRRTDTAVTPSEVIGPEPVVRKPPFWSMSCSRPSVTRSFSADSTRTLLTAPDTEAEPNETNETGTRATAVTDTAVLPGIETGNRSPSKSTRTFVVPVLGKTTRASTRAAAATEAAPSAARPPGSVSGSPPSVTRTEPLLSTRCPPRRNTMRNKPPDTPAEPETNRLTGAEATRDPAT